MIFGLLHYWIGSINDPQLFYRDYFYKFNIITDNIKILHEFKNDIPDKSWMLYLLEVFNPQQIAVEINLISQYDDQNYFEAIFNGIIRYRFTKVLPEVGHIYLRQIKFERSNPSIEYYLKNLNTQTDENYILNLNNDPPFSFQFSRCFTGVEWWNKNESRPYPIKFKIEISNLMYGFNHNPYDSQPVVFFPINTLSSDKDGHSFSYPVKFNYDGIKNGCFCYNLEPGYFLDVLNYASI